MQQQQMSRPVRHATALIALAAAATLVLQTAVDMAAGEGLWPSLWSQARYFTNLTVLATALICGRLALRGRWDGPALPAALTVWIVLVGLVYHALLAATHHPAGWDVLVNLMQHTILPGAVLLWWLTAAPKAGLGWIGPVIWAGFPLIYAGYAIARGMSDGIYPYFFLDPERSGWPMVAGYVIGLGAGFIGFGCLLVAAARIAGRRGKADQAFADDRPGQ